jgi:type I restriction enzyme S subunit
MYQPATISTKEMIPNGKYPVYGANGKIGRYDKYNHEDPQLLITCRGATCGSVNISEEFSWINGNAMVVQPDPKIATLEYIKYAFLGGIDVKSSITGSAQPQITRTTLEIVKVPIPSIEEQKFIVEKLDKAFAEIDLLERNLEKRSESVGQLFESLLSSAFSSGASDVEHGNVEYNQNRSMKKLPLKDICTVFDDGDWIESKDQSESGIRLIQTGNIGVGKFRDRIEKARWISEETFEKLGCTEVREGDVLISRLPDPVGRACRLPALEHKAITAVDCSIVRFKDNVLDPRFFVYYSQTSSYSASVSPLISGSTRERISREKLGTIMVPIPTLEEQKAIVDKLDKFSFEIESLKELIQAEKSQASSLRQSLLRNAFTQEGAAV